MPLLPQLEVSSDTNTKSPAKASDAVTLVNLATTGVNPSPDAMNQEDAATKTTLEDVTIDLTGKITVTLDATIDVSPRATTDVTGTTTVTMDVKTDLSPRVTTDVTGTITVTLDARIDLSPRAMTLVIMAVATGTVRAVIRDLVVTDTVEFGDSEEVAATEMKVKKSYQKWWSRVKPHKRSETKPVKN